MEIILTSILAFISTNIDDVFLLILFFGNKRFNNREIVTGQILGIVTLIAISLGLSFIGLVINKAYIGLLGFLPIYLGLRDVLQFGAHQKEGDEIIPKSNGRNIFTVAGTTIANGGDNIGIYVPLFAALAWAEKITMISIFLMMTVAWCALANYSIKHPLLAKSIDRYGHKFTPFILIILGIYILYESDTWSLLSSF